MNSTEKFVIKSDGTGFGDALTYTEQFGENAGLTKKENLHLRLLCEELFGIIRNVAGDVEADYSVTGENKQFTLNLVSEVKMTQELKKQLIAVSSKGKNAAAKGFMGKIKDMIATALLPDEFGLTAMTSFSLGLMSAAPATSSAARQTMTESIIWSMNKYKTEIDSDRNINTEFKDAWDELEKSIVASIADDVVVKITGSVVEISIKKAF